MNLYPEISVIIPCYNSYNFIEETIQSVFTQTFDNWEIIIVNDGSTDGTDELLKKYVSLEKVTIIDQTNKGVSAARNHGFSISKGKYVVFLDSDDVLSKNFLKSRYSFLEENKNIDFCCGDVYTFYNNIHNVLTKEKGIYNNINYKVLTYRKNFTTVPSNFMFRKKALIKYNIRFNENLSSTADRFFLLELSLYLKGGYIENSPLFYRIHEKSMSSKLTMKLIKDNELFYKYVDANPIYYRDFKKHYLFYKNYILGMSYLKKLHPKCLLYLSKLTLNFPSMFLMKIINKIWPNVR